jgi:hypothetical protein
MEQVIIQDCDCIALPEGVVTALDLKRELALDVTLADAADAILMTPRTASTGASIEMSRPHCTILPLSSR